MIKAAIPVLLLLTLTATLLYATLPLNAASTRHFDIFQNNNMGGAGCSGQPNCFNSTFPGPSITVNQGDVVTVTIHNNDTTTPSHTFTNCVLNSNPCTVSSQDSFDQTVSNGQSPVTITIPTTKAGSFTYECTIHPADMRGAFTVNASAPINPVIVFALLLTTMSTILLVKRKRN